MKHQILPEAAVRLSRRLATLMLTVQLGLLAVIPAPAGLGMQAEPGADALDKINHIVVIYQENHSFDNYLGTFPGADGIANAGAAGIQVDKSGKPYASLPAPLANAVGGVRSPHAHFPAELPNGPFLMNDYIVPDDETANEIHAYYRQQYQIDGGKMDRFVAWTDAGAFPMGYWDLKGLPLYELGREYTVADRFFQGAFGGSFLNHQW